VSPECDLVEFLAFGFSSLVTGLGLALGISITFYLDSAKLRGSSLQATVAWINTIGFSFSFFSGIKFWEFGRIT
jgi:hypothetical protein